MRHQYHPAEPVAEGLCPSICKADLDAVLAVGWVDLGHLAPGERRLASRFYETAAVDRARLRAVQEVARSSYEEWTGSRPHPMGSSYAGTALGCSDIDLYAPMPEGCGSLGELETLLAGRAVYRKTRPGPTGEDRHLFSYHEGGTRVDLNFVPPSDYRLALAVVHEIRRGLTREDRVAHTWVKHLLQERAADDSYDAWKTAMRLRSSATLRALMATGAADSPGWLQDCAPLGCG
ncbi:hypothetical protein [Streptacidiphilus neutrinimicus]|uniref:hypothetical protein n=1 Tax=Streptacidiphilus neutrinimicus TaxID=105420 RepID=UPI0005A63DE3|nr:hypothetical protein [Streptacidiphilus neutrinimicus]